MLKYLVFTRFNVEIFSYYKKDKDRMNALNETIFHYTGLNDRRYLVRLIKPRRVMQDVNAR